MLQEECLTNEEPADVYKQEIVPAIEILQTASGLTDEAAKTCVYYAAGTYGLKQLDQYPILILQGATGTGKSEAMKALAKIVHNPSWLGTNLTTASLRDGLGKAKDATAFIEEGDSATEGIIANRYSRDTSKTSVKRATLAGWSDQGLDYFGATVLHKRKPFNDAATASRSIIVKTRNNPGNYFILEVEDSVRNGLKQVWEQSYQKLQELDYSVMAEYAEVAAPTMRRISPAASSRNRKTRFALDILASPLQVSAAYTAHSELVK